jgi:transposase
MLIVETIGRIRRAHFSQGKSIKEIARELKVSRNTVRKIPRSGETSSTYEREIQPRPKLGRWKADIDRLLTKNAGAPARERLTLIRLFEEPRELGYEGGYDAVRRYARSWSREHASQTASAYVPLSFAPGEAYQFDWSHEIVVLSGVTTTLKVAHVRLCHSRMMFVRAYPRENQVGLVRERFFTPRLRFKTYDELNVWLMDRCIAYAKAHPHPERPEQTVWEVFEEERPKLIGYRGRFDGFHAQPASVSKTCLVRFDNNKYSVSASAVGRPVEVHAYAERVVLRQDGRVVAEHPRKYGRGGTVYDPWHYVPVLARKPGALRNGAPFKDWAPPAALERVRRKLAESNDGDRQMVAILAAVLTDGLPAVEAACAQAIAEGVHSSDVIINILARRRDPGPVAPIFTPDALKPRHAPVADCARYDLLRRA